MRGILSIFDNWVIVNKGFNFMCFDKNEENVVIIHDFG